MKDLTINSFFDKYIFEPNSNELTPTDQKIAWTATLILGACSFGMVLLGVWIIHEISSCFWNNYHVTQIHPQSNSNLEELEECEIEKNPIYQVPTEIFESVYSFLTHGEMQNIRLISSDWNGNTLIHIKHTQANYIKEMNQLILDTLDKTKYADLIKECASILGENKVNEAINLTAVKKALMETRTRLVAALQKMQIKDLKVLQEAFKDKKEPLFLVEAPFLALVQRQVDCYSLGRDEFHKLALTCLEKGFFNEAIKIANRLSPTYDSRIIDEIYLAIASSLTEKGRYAEAIEVTSHFEHWFNRRNCLDKIADDLIKKCDFDTALLVIERMTSGNKWRHYLIIAEGLWNLQLYEKAERRFDEALKDAKDFSGWSKIFGLLNIADVLWKIQKFEAAKKLLAEAVKEVPATEHTHEKQQQVRIFCDLAKVFWLKGLVNDAYKMMDEAINETEQVVIRAIEFKNSNKVGRVQTGHDEYLSIAQIYINMGQYSKAKKVLEKFKEIPIDNNTESALYKEIVQKLQESDKRSHL